MTWSIRNILVTLIDLFLGFVSLFIGLRIVLALFGANPGTPIVAWIYAVSGSFVAPFSGIFPNLSIGSGVLDFVALIALLAYMILGYFVIAVIDMALTPKVITREPGRVL